PEEPAYFREHDLGRTLCLCSQRPDFYCPSGGNHVLGNHHTPLCARYRRIVIDHPSGWYFEDKKRSTDLNLWIQCFSYSMVTCGFCRVRIALKARYLKIGLVYQWAGTYSSRNTVAMCGGNSHAQYSLHSHRMAAVTPVMEEATG